MRGVKNLTVSLDAGGAEVVGGVERSYFEALVWSIAGAALRGQRPMKRKGLPSMRTRPVMG